MGRFLFAANPSAANGNLIVSTTDRSEVPVAQLDKVTLSGLNDLKRDAEAQSPYMKRLGFSSWLWLSGYERLKRELQEDTEGKSNDST
jgi:hypothetical protein